MNRMTSGVECGNDALGVSDEERHTYRPVTPLSHLLCGIHTCATVLGPQKQITTNWGSESTEICSLTLLLGGQRSGWSQRVTGSAPF